MVFQPDGVYTNIFSPTNIDTKVISQANRLGGISPQFFQAQSERLRIWFGWYITLLGHNDNLKILLLVRKLSDAAGPNAPLPMSVGDQRNLIPQAHKGVRIDCHNRQFVRLNTADGAR